jgi:catalase-peroxidase
MLGCSTVAVFDHADAAVRTTNGREAANGCPVAHQPVRHPTQSGAGNETWWPGRLNLKILAKNPAGANPLGEDFNNAEAFLTLDLDRVKRDIEQVLTTSQD